MPGPGSRKTKPKKHSSPAVARPTPASYVGDIENAQHWNQIVLILCDFFRLPELTTRSGLKKVHNDFDAIYRRLDQACEENKENEKIVGGIVGIYAKMCADSILRNKLFEKGLLQLLMPLLDKPNCRHMALRSLNSIAHHGSESVHTEIAKCIPSLLKLIEDHPDDPTIAELSVTIISHCISELLREHQSATTHTPYIPSYLKVQPILTSIEKQLKNPAASRYLLVHALDLLATLAYHDGPRVKANRSIVNFFIASLRANSWEFRCTSLSAIIRMHLFEEEDDVRHFDPNVLMGLARRKFPQHINDVLMDYGPERSEIHLMLRATVDYQTAMRGIAQTRTKDYYGLGLQLYELIMRTEFSIADGAYQAENPKTGKLEIIDVGLPFKRWTEALPYCAKVIRATPRNPKDLDKADVLEIKHLIMSQRVGDAAKMAENSLERNSNVAYYFYAMSLIADRTKGLKAAKKGIKCKDTSPFVRFQLLQRAVEHAGDLGISMLMNEAGHNEKKWEEGIAFLMSSLEDSRMYVSEAPPDNRHMRKVLYWNALLTFIIRGHEVSKDLREIRDTLDKIKFTHDFAEFTRLPNPKINLRLAEETIVDNFSGAVEEWGDVTKNMAGFDEAPRPVDREKAGDDLAAWLDDLRLDNGEQQPSRVHPKVNANHVALYHCSWCGNPSAVLRKCSGCGLTRYCDSGCQKSHWAEHKKTCKPATT